MFLLRVLRIVCLLGVLVAGCGESGEREGLLALVDAGDYAAVDERVAGLRARGMVEPWIDYAEGVSAFHSGVEELARTRLSSAAGGDPQFVRPAADLLAAAARTDFEAGFRDRAKGRMATAVLIDPELDPEPMLEAVADHLFRFIRDFDAARPLYERLYRERPDPVSRHPEWVFRYGLTLEKGGDIDGARAIYEEFRETWPDDVEMGNRVAGQYMDILIQQAEEAGEAGDVDEALRLVKMTKLGGFHMARQQRAEFVAGEICEEAGRFDEARVHFARVLEYAPRVKSDLYDLATARLEALDARTAN